jgi:hypothetical protein
MPYRRQALLQIDSDQPIKGKIRIRSVPRVDPFAGYLRAESRPAREARSKANDPWLAANGRGHFAGLFLNSEGTTRTPRLDGGLRVRLDGGATSWRQPLAAYFHGKNDPPEYPEAGPASGFPVVSRDGERWRVAAYRWHLADPIVFARALEVAGGPNVVNNQDQIHTSVALFWYGEHPGPARAGD